jgi:hypothetical protein
MNLLQDIPDVRAARREFRPHSDVFRHPVLR